MHFRIKLLGGAFSAFAISGYFYKKHMYELEMFNQMNKLFADSSKSGIFVQQRQAFPSLGFIQWLIPYHQSLKIVDKRNGTTRHIGLGQPPNAGYFSRDCQFIHHTGDKFDWLNRYEVSIPIEIWVPYKRKYGYFPQEKVAIDIDILNAVTRCADEEHLNKEVGVELYQTKFLSIISETDETGVTQHEISTCQTAVMHALQLSEKLTVEKNEVLKQTEQKDVP